MTLVDGKSRERLTKYFDSEEINPIVKSVIDFKLRHVNRWGDQLYNELINAASEEREVNIPFEDLKKALGRVEHLLPSIKREGDGAGKALLKLADEYSDLAKQRVKESNKKK